MSKKTYVGTSKTVKIINHLATIGSSDAPIVIGHTVKNALTELRNDKIMRRDFL